MIRIKKTRNLISKIFKLQYLNHPEIKKMIYKKTLRKHKRNSKFIKDACQRQMQTMITLKSTNLLVIQLETKIRKL